MSTALAELDRWADDGGQPVCSEPASADLPPLIVTVHADPGPFLEQLARAMRPLIDSFGKLVSAVQAAGRELGRALGMPGDDPRFRRWPHDTVPRRNRDWLPAAEPKVDRARRLRVERAMRARARHADRRRRQAARKAAA